VRNGNTGINRAVRFLRQVVTPGRSVGILTLLLVTGYGLLNQVPAATASQRTIAVSPTPKGGPPFTPASIGQAIKLATKAGVNGDQLSNKWADLEPSPGKYVVSDPQGGFNYLGGVLGWKLMYTLAVIDTTVKQTPSDLQSVAWDDPQMIARFHSLIDALVPIFNSHLAYIAVGNEVDIYLSLHPGEWAAYKTFYDDAVAYIHSVAPGVQVGVATTFTNTFGPAEANVQNLITNSDVAIFTYYPMTSDFVPLGATVPLADFPRMVTFAGGRPVVMQEVGLPASKILSSSPREVAAFIDNVFAAWNSVGASIPFLSYVMLHDLPKAYCEQLVQYYGVSDPDGHFVAYLSSLGLRTVKGKARPGWRHFVRDIKKMKAQP
jgi:hypothetical protein